MKKFIHKIIKVQYSYKKRGGIKGKEGNTYIDLVKRLSTLLRKLVVCVVSVVSVRIQDVGVVAKSGQVHPSLVGHLEGYLLGS